ncbi:flagellar hook-length control protein FliK [Endozoicomonas ascidiicola]|uniref:flagellar hook-length control protein FliK n=1 Tax=Endozoicomonas ascidiicola TaxID=1698521 RepID=UPI00082A5BC7|nr:flagellar hook-length control protein FliK [Endozoicomonas ascidiicola]
MEAGVSSPVVNTLTLVTPNASGVQPVDSNSNSSAAQFSEIYSILSSASSSNSVITAQPEFKLQPLALEVEEMQPFERSLPEDNLTTTDQFTRWQAVGQHEVAEPANYPLEGIPVFEFEETTEGAPESEYSPTKHGEHNSDSELSDSMPVTLISIDDRKASGTDREDKSSFTQHEKPLPLTTDLAVKERPVNSSLKNYQWQDKPLETSSPVVNESPEDALKAVIKLPDEPLKSVVNQQPYEPAHNIQSSGHSSPATEKIITKPPPTLLAPERTVVLQEQVIPQRLSSALIQLIRRGESALEVRLDPPELGRLSLTIKVDAETLSLQVNASSPAARELLMNSSDRLRQTLAEQGLSLSEMSVDVRSETDSRKSHSRGQSPDGTSAESSLIADWGVDNREFLTGEQLFKSRGGRLLDYFV